MAAASLDANFKEELSAIEQCERYSSCFAPLNRLTHHLLAGFRVLSEAERTAALYSLIQHSTQVQIRFFITVLQQMARSDPMTALLSPAVGTSMQAQMDAKLASMGLKSPGLPPSPAVRSFSAGSGPPGSGAATRQSLGGGGDFLSPESANNATGNATSGDPAATLAQQRARLKANAAHRISAPGTLTSETGRPATIWSQSSLTQVAERAPSPASDLSPASNSSNMRPKSTDFTGIANQFARSPRPNATSVTQDSQGAEIDLSVQDLRLNEQLSPMVGGSWASMVNTPMVPMFTEGSAIGQGNVDAAAAKLANWSMGNAGSRVVLDDAKKFRRESRGQHRCGAFQQCRRIRQGQPRTTWWQCLKQSSWHERRMAQPRFV